VGSEEAAGLAFTGDKINDAGRESSFLEKRSEIQNGQRSFF